MNRALALLQKAVDVRPNEVRALLLACLFNFVILGQLLRHPPDPGRHRGSSRLENLSWMFTGTLVAMLLANAAFSAIVARMPRRKFLPHRLPIFHRQSGHFLSAHADVRRRRMSGSVARFYVWVSVFNLFVVTLFWAFMTDLFNSEQAKRLFAFIAVGGSLGAIAGPIVTASLVHKSGRGEFDSRDCRPPRNRALVREVFPGGFRAPPRRIETDERKADEELTDPEVYNGSRRTGAEQVIGGGIISGITHVVRSPYLLGICALHAPLRDHFDHRLFPAGRHHRPSIPRSRAADGFLRAARSGGKHTHGHRPAFAHRAVAEMVRGRHYARVSARA